ncbi:hypothetical protein EV1_014908 [Malus domestica]|nr:extensin-like [Malus domestica]
MGKSKASVVVADVTDVDLELEYQQHQILEQLQGFHDSVSLLATRQESFQLKLTDIQASLANISLVQHHLMEEIRASRPPPPSTPHSTDLDWVFAYSPGFFFYPASPTLPTHPVTPLHPTPFLSPASNLGHPFCPFPLSHIPYPPQPLTHPPHHSFSPSPPPFVPTFPPLYFPCPSTLPTP